MTAQAEVCSSLSSAVNSRAPWGGWGSPLPGMEGGGREKEVVLNPPLSWSPFLPSPNLTSD